MSELPKSDAPAGPTIGDMIRAERERQGLSQEALAKMVGISQPALRKIEKNITVKSKFQYELMHILGLGWLTDKDRIRELIRDHKDDAYAKQAIDHLADSLEVLDAHEKKAGTDRIPVYTTSDRSNGGMVLSPRPITHLPKLKGVADTDDCYGVTLVTNRYSPAFHSGDIAICDAGALLSEGCRVMLINRNTDGFPLAHFAFLENSTSLYWFLRNPDYALGGRDIDRVSKKDWPEGHRIVATIYLPT